MVDGILRGEGATTAQQRAAAFAGTDHGGSDPGFPPPVRELLGKVVTRPGQIADADFAAAAAAGYTGDQLFELVVCAAAGQSARLYEAGLAALDSAAGVSR